MRNGDDTAAQVHLHEVRAPMRQFVAGGILAAASVFVGGALVWMIAFDPAVSQSGGPGCCPESPDAQSPIRVSVVVTIPSPSPTATDTPSPTTVFPTPTTDPIPPCGKATPGAMCHRQPLPPPTPTPVPYCEAVTATPPAATGGNNDLCQWRAAP